MRTGLVTENQQNVTFLMKQTAEMILLLTSKNPGKYLVQQREQTNYYNLMTLISKSNTLKELEM